MLFSGCIYSIKDKQKIIEFSLPKQDLFFENFQGMDEYIYLHDRELDFFYVLKVEDLINRIIDNGANPK
jgi:hypothetical protein